MCYIHVGFYHRRCEDRRIWKLLTDLVGTDVIDPRDVPALLVEKISKLTEELTVKEQEMRDLEVLIEEVIKRQR